MPTANDQSLTLSARRCPTGRVRGCVAERWTYVFLPSPNTRAGVAVFTMFDH